MTRDQTTPEAQKRVLDLLLPEIHRVRDDAGQRLCAVAGDAAGVQGGAGHVGAGGGDAAGAEGVETGRRGELTVWVVGDSQPRCLLTLRRRAVRMRVTGFPGLRFHCAGEFFTVVAWQ